MWWSCDMYNHYACPVPISKPLHAYPFYTCYRSQNSSDWPRKEKRKSNTRVSRMNWKFPRPNRWETSRLKSLGIWLGLLVQTQSRPLLLQGQRCRFVIWEYIVAEHTTRLQCTVVINFDSEIQLNTYLYFVQKKFCNSVESIKFERLSEILGILGLLASALEDQLKCIKLSICTQVTSMACWFTGLHMFSITQYLLN